MTGFLKRFKYSRKLKKLKRTAESFCKVAKQRNSCLRCGACCQAIHFIELTEVDLAREPRLHEFAKKVGQEWRMENPHFGQYGVMLSDLLNNTGCPFLEKGTSENGNRASCTIEKTKPDVCRDFRPSFFNCHRKRMELMDYGFDSKSSCALGLNAVFVYFSLLNQEVEKFCEFVNIN